VHDKAIRTNNASKQIAHFLSRGWWHVPNLAAPDSKNGNKLTIDQGALMRAKRDYYRACEDTTPVADLRTNPVKRLWFGQGSIRNNPDHLACLELSAGHQITYVLKIMHCRLREKVNSTTDNNNFGGSCQSCMKLVKEVNDPSKCWRVGLQVDRVLATEGWNYARTRYAYMDEHMVELASRLHKQRDHEIQAQQQAQERMEVCRTVGMIGASSQSISLSLSFSSSSSSLSSLSAASCYQKARELAHKTLGGLTPQESVRCRSCNQGKVKVTMSTHGSNKPPEVLEVPCIDCDGKFEQVSQKDAFESAVQKNVWCQCRKDTAGVVKAKDGSQVFGNVTYLCRKCGMVTQFG
jgi:hypothetical protein